MASDDTTTLGAGFSNGSLSMVGTAIHKMTKRDFSRPTCDALVAYMLDTWGLNIDAPAATIMHALGLAEVGGNGMGPYNGRVNANEQRKGSAFRLVLGAATGTYRLIQLA